jgi:Zn-finger protein
MHEKGIILANEAMKEKKTKGPDLKCPYFPCHKTLEDCTFCYCPFYPCNNPIFGGKLITSKKTGEKVWDCSDCELPHKKKNAEKILKWLLSHCTKFEELSHEQLMELHKEIVEENLKNGC